MVFWREQLSKKNVSVEGCWNDSIAVNSMLVPDGGGR